MQQSSGGAAAGGGGGAPGGQQQQQQQEEMKRQQQDMKNSILSQVLTQEARARRKASFVYISFLNLNLKFSIYCGTWLQVNTLALTKPDKAQMVENHLIQQARTGQLMNKFGEDQLISLLERLSEQTQKKTVVNVS